MRAKLSSLTADKATHVGERGGLKRQHDELERIIQTDTRESQDESVGAIEADLSLTTKKIADETRAAAELEQEISDAKYDDKRRALKFEIATKEGERETLNAEFASLNQHSETRATLNVKTDNLKTKEDFINSQSVGSCFRKFTAVANRSVAYRLALNQRRAADRAVPQARRHRPCRSQYGVRRHEGADVSKMTAFLQRPRAHLLC